MVYRSQLQRKAFTKLLTDGKLDFYECLNIYLDILRLQKILKMWDH